MIKRDITEKMLALSCKFPVVAITGPRQSGKTTLARSLFPKKTYVTLENPDTLESAVNDPRFFLEKFSTGAVLDEIQRAPKLFSYIQEIVDERKKNGLFIITGSQQFELMSQITQSLAGRVALLTLLPLNYSEIKSQQKKETSIEHQMYLGGYPRIYDQSIAPEDWFLNYIRTYIERDVRLIKNIDDLTSFQRFLKMCAARTGQLLNLTALGNDCGISHNTAKAWLSILEASYITYTLAPHHQNFGKRLMKAPKLYFWDTGLVCHLLNIQSEENLAFHAKRGEIFETWVLSELIKNYLNAGKRPSLFFWQDKRHEIDVVIEKGDELIPLEIKSAKTINQDHFKSLAYWCQIAKYDPKKAMLVFAGDEDQKRSQGHVYSWRNLAKIG